MAFMMIRLWHLAVVVTIFSHISTSLPSLERNKRQVELKLMHDAGMRREYEKAAKLLQTLMNYKRSVPNTSGEKDPAGLFDKNNLDLWSLKEKLLKLKTCLQFVQKLDTSQMALSTHFGTYLFLLLVSVLQAQEPNAECSVVNEFPSIKENNDPGVVVTNITTAAGITVTINPTMDHTWFEINGSQLILKDTVDYEVNNILVVLTIENVNDNPPVFKERNITVHVREDTEVNTVVVPQANVTATDADGDTIFYNLTGSTVDLEYFNIQGINNPQIVLYKILDYETINLMEFTLYAMDGSSSTTALHTATAEITIHILQTDRRPPWFQPCTLSFGRIMCIDRGYTGKVNISDNMTEPVILKPGPLYAVDGDRDLNEKIVYEIADGNDDNTFSISNYTGNITMNKPVHTLKSFTLYVVASQENNPFRYSQTTVEIEVVRRNDHKPYFNTSYSGTVSVESPVSSIVVEADSPSVPIMIFAVDEDFPPNGFNPDIQYKIQNSSAFRVTSDGFLLTTEVLKAASTLTLWAIANDTATLEEASTVITVDVTPLATIPTTATSATITTTAIISSTTTSTTASSAIPGTGPTFPKPLSSSSSLPPGINSTLPTPSSGSTRSTTAFARTSQLPSVVNPATGTTKSTAQPSHTGTTKSSSTHVSGTASGTAHSTSPSSSQIQTTTNSIPDGSPGTDNTTQSTPWTFPTGATRPTTTGISVTTSRTVPSTSLSSSQIQTTTSSIPNENATAGRTTQSTAGTVQSGATKPSTISGAVPYDQYVRNMAALGGTLGSLLVIALLLLGVVSCKYYKMKQAPEEGNSKFVESFTNANFEPDETPNSDRKYDKLLASNAMVGDSPSPPEEINHTSSASEASTETEEVNEGLDSEKEVRSILTKEKRVEDDGYKAVWFKEDIDPEAKDDVVMIGEDSDLEQNNESDSDNDDDRVDNDDGEEDDSGRGGSYVSVIETDQLPETRSITNQFLGDLETNDIYF
ncbi:hypothetical protein JRQ81_000269 [Phrynocephalus forsythii]|uniref:Cadherin domain-containing protein n=1 Tax=Phrynocephalus forsythii TaxID=171643 RepID=A0A9Q0Y7Q7_9SAUR|nr:hypothetical protein JRQ81_000269 [Phrynocephalus forsythii]